MLVEYVESGLKFIFCTYPVFLEASSLFQVENPYQELARKASSTIVKGKIPFDSDPPPIK